MFGIKHAKFASMNYVLHYKNGRVVREGRGLSFFYFAPNSSIVAIPIGSNDLPFIFNEITADYQTVSIQGQISYKISDPKKLADVLDFTVDDNGHYKKNELEKLNQRIINEAQTATSSYIHGIKLKDAIMSAKFTEEKILTGLKSSELVRFFGLEILGTSILAIQASPEMGRALETETRERLQQEADQAIYERRNFAVEQERKIRESELNTEIAVEEKQKQIAEKRMESDVLKTENERKLKQMRLETDIAVENQRKDLVGQKTANDKLEAETQGYVLETTLKPFKEMDWKVLTAINNQTDARQTIALAFRQLAENAEKIGTLHISPDLLENLIGDKQEKRK